MAKKIAEKEGISIIEIPAGQKLFISYLVGETVQAVADAEKASRGSTLLKFKVNSVCVVEELTENLLTAKHLRFARGKREGRLILEPVPKIWPRLRVALHHAGLKPFNVPGGLGFALTYPDELLIADFSMSGSNGWIILRKDIGGYLDALPPLKDSGELGILWVDHVGFLNFPDDCRIRVCSQDPRDEDPVFWPENRLHENRVVARVIYDLGSRLVKGIHEWSEVDSRRVLESRNWKDIGEKEAVAYLVRPAVRAIEVGKRLPQEALNLLR